jgi:hypothetical protein
MRDQDCSGRCQKIARNHGTRNLTLAHYTTPDSASRLRVVLGREVLGGVVNGPRIDGKNGAGGSMQRSHWGFLVGLRTGPQL